MTANAIYSIAALAFSFVAVLISGISARRQSVDARHNNIVLFMSELGQRSRSQDFQEAQDYVLTKLSEFDPSLGIFRLPYPARQYALLIGGFYQDVGFLVITGVIAEDLAVAKYYTPIKDAWQALEPFIQGERELRRARGAGNFFGAFEQLAAYVESVSHEKVRQKFIRRTVPASKGSDKRSFWHSIGSGLHSRASETVRQPNPDGADSVDFAPARQGMQQLSAAPNPMNIDPE